MWNGWLISSFRGKTMSPHARVITDWLFVLNFDLHCVHEAPSCPKLKNKSKSPPGKLLTKSRFDHICGLQRRNGWNWSVRADLCSKRMHSRRMRTVRCSGHLSCHICSLPPSCMPTAMHPCHTPCHAHPVPHTPPPCMPPLAMHV